MNRSIPRQWWVPLFLIDIALIIFSTMRIALGTGSISALFIILSSTCITVSQLFKRAVLFLWGSAFVLATIALLFAILPSR